MCVDACPGTCIQCKWESVLMDIQDHTTIEPLKRGHTFNKFWESINSAFLSLVYREAVLFLEVLNNYKKSIGTRSSAL